MKIQAAKRIFLYNGCRLPDPNPTFTPEKAVELLSLSHPELGTATLAPPKVKNGEMVYEISRSVGAKG